MSRPFVTCICPTYGRPPNYLWLLEEVVESFKRQTYPLELRELLILNDASGQVLKCDEPGVTVLNTEKRFSSLGAKYNALVQASNDGIILPWEDDDISLSNRIETAVRKFEAYCDDFRIQYYNPQGYFFLLYKNSNPAMMSTTHPMGVCHNASAFCKEAWAKVGGYTEESGAQDASMDSKLKANVKTLSAKSRPTEWGYVYRWGVQPVHLSGRAPHDEFYDDIGKAEIVPGVYDVVPKWHMNYEEMALSSIAHV